MKKVSLLVVMALGVFLLSACAPVASAYVKLNPELADWVVYGATVLVGFLLVKAQEIPFVARLIEYFKINQYVTVISAWLAGVVIQLIQVNVLDRVPFTWDSVVTIAMQLLVAVLVTLFAFRKLADRGVKSFK